MQTILNLVEAKAAVLRHALKSVGKTISTVESFTGGTLALLMNANDCCNCSFILNPKCYDVLSITPAILRSGSEKTASILAYNCLQKAGSDWSIAIIKTGEKIIIAIGSRESVTVHPVLYTDQDVSYQTCSAAIFFLLQRIRRSHPELAVR